MRGQRSRKPIGFRLWVVHRIEDEYDLNAYKEAMAEFKKNPVTYSLDEVEKEPGLK
ncbi:MAG: type II toxin-antitoxin system RelB family antitoxin [Lachnoanaerobaculum saburreum]